MIYEADVDIYNSCRLSNALVTKLQFIPYIYIVWIKLCFEKAVFFFSLINIIIIIINNMIIVVNIFDIVIIFSESIFRLSK